MNSVPEVSVPFPSHKEARLYSNHAMPILCHRVISVLAGAALALVAQPISAQESRASPASEQPPAPPQNEVIDILVPPPEGEIDPRRIEQCEREREAATISRDIVVCREIVEDTSHRYSGDRDAAQRRYAEETAFAGDLQTPDVAGPGIFRGPATVGGLCIPGLQKCPPPPALMIDVTALPKAPPGSDADRIARGMAPRGNDQGDPPSQEELLGLPQRQPGGGESDLSREGSAAPEGAQ